MSNTNSRAWVDASVSPDYGWAVIQEGVVTKWFKYRGEAHDEADRRNGNPIAKKNGPNLQTAQ